MTKQFLLILMTYTNSDQVQMEAPFHPIGVLPNHEWCEKVGAEMVKSTVAKIEGKGGTQGSVWYYCQPVEGLEIGAP